MSLKETWKEKTITFPCHFFENDEFEDWDKMSSTVTTYDTECYNEALWDLSDGWVCYLHPQGPFVKNNYTNSELKKPFNSKGFAYIYSHQDFLDKTIKKELDENSLQTAHSILRPGSLIKIINIKTNESIILRVDKRFDYPEFYKLVITQAVADKLNLQNDLPLIEVIEV